MASAVLFKMPTAAKQSQAQKTQQKKVMQNGNRRFLFCRIWQSSNCGPPANRISRSAPCPRLLRAWRAPDNYRAPRLVHAFPAHRLRTRYRAPPTQPISRSVLPPHRTQPKGCSTPGSSLPSDLSPPEVIPCSPTQPSSASTPAVSAVPPCDPFPVVILPPASKPAKSPRSISRTSHWRWSTKLHQTRTQHQRGFRVLGIWIE